VNKKYYEEREELSQAVRNSSTHEELRDVAKQILALAMKLEQDKLFRNSD